MSRICWLDIASEHLACKRRSSSMSTIRVQEVGQGVTKEGAEFRIWRQTDFRLIIQLHENPQNIIWGRVKKHAGYSVSTREC